MKKIVCILLTAFVFQAQPSVSADLYNADEFIAPTATNMLQTALRFGALDINNNIMIDDYAKIAECDLFKAFNNDEFKWQKIRAGLREKIKSEVITYPTSFFINGFVSLDRYDFDNKLFKLGGADRISSVNALPLTSMPGNVCGQSLKALPKRFVAVLDKQVHVPGFVMDEADANALLERMKQAGNPERQIMAKFNIRIMHIDRVRIDYSQVDVWNDTGTYIGKDAEMRLYARLDSLEFFEDKEMAKRIYIYRPAN